MQTGGLDFNNLDSVLTEQQAGAVRAIVLGVLARQSVPDLVMYFMPDGDKLVTVRYHADSVHTLRNELSALSQRIAEQQRRIARLERPWWRRWLSR